jgi:hypothetical protein
MKVFISWSGAQSRTTAERISEWLKSLFQKNVEVFVSSKDIEKGDRWADRLAAVLQDYNFGVVVLNTSNRDKPWINFEAGALSKSVTKAKLVPLLCGFTPGDLLESPLGQFQGVEATKDGLLELAKTINMNLEKAMDDASVIEAFDVWWDKKGRPITEFSDDKGVGAKKDAVPTLRDVMARIDRTESLMTDTMRSIAEQLLARHESLLINIDRRLDRPDSAVGKVKGLSYFAQAAQEPVKGISVEEFLKLVKDYSNAVKKDEK